MSPSNLLAPLTLAAEADGPHLLITAGVHGDEYEPMLAARQLIQEFDGRLIRGRVTIFPVANRAALDRRCRTAEDALDLARVFPGRADGSITERTAAALATWIQRADYYIDLHTGGSIYKILPLAGYMIGKQPAVLEAQRTMARAFGAPIVWGTAGAAGRSLSVARDADVPAIYVEHGGGDYSQQAVNDLVAGCLNVASTLALTEPVVAAGKVEYLVEDRRPESGHLQKKHPAPIAGLFAPQVQLGHRIHAGDRLGEVIDPLGDDRVPVVADSDGIVLFLRVSPPVAAGDGLGGILPIAAPGEVHYDDDRR